MTTKEVAQICGVSEKTVYNNASKANVVLEHGKAKDWTEDELKRLQLVLMRNAANAGGQQTEGSMVKSTVESTFQSGLTRKSRNCSLKSGGKKTEKNLHFPLTN